METIKNAPNVERRSAILDIGFVSSCNATGYRDLASTPEIKAGIEKIAEIVSTMTIHLMKNGELGDERVKDGLARKIDINPNVNMTRQLFISWVVQEMLLEGNAVVIPKVKDGKVANLEPLPTSKYTFIEIPGDYAITQYNGAKKSSGEILNFRFNPKMEHPWVGQSQKVILTDLIADLGQANKTVSDFMKNKMLPSIVVTVDAFVDELKDEEGRKNIEDQFLSRSEAGQPWIIPGDLIDVKEIKPLSLKDIAIHESIKINKETAASILGIPPYLLGVGEFDKEEYNNFIRSKISVICKAIEQELTNKLIISNDRYFQFNRKSMLNYDLQEQVALYKELYTLGIVTGNEVRDAFGMSPVAGLDQLIVLENYIPVSKLGDQKKLGGNQENE